MPNSQQPPQGSGQQFPPPNFGPHGARVRVLVAVLDGVYIARINKSWLLCIAYAAQEYSHPHLRMIGGVRAGDYYFFNAGAVPQSQRTAYTHTLGDLPLRDQRAPALSLMRDFPDYHHILECWANAAWQREAAANRHKTAQNP